MLDRSKSFVLATFFVAALFFASAAHATVLLDNFGSGDTPTGGTITDPFPRWALVFDLNSAQSGAWTFTIRADVGGPDSYVVLNLYNDNAGSPNESSVALALSGATQVSSGFYAVSGNGSLPVGRYWLVGSTTPDGTYDWRSRSSDYTAGGTATGATIVSGNSPGQYARVNDGSASGWNNSVAYNLGLRVDVSPVPEPAHYSLFAALFLIVCSVGQLCWTRRAAVVALRRGQRK